jgi:hypothetical protein
VPGSFSHSVLVLFNPPIHFFKSLVSHVIIAVENFNLWHAYFLSLSGAGTAMLGERAAMACTVAVEEVITEHYNSQLRLLHERADTKDEEALRQVCLQ